MVLKGIRKERDDTAENNLASRPWSALSPNQLPACLKERGAALNAESYTITVRHPFAHSSPNTHGHFDWTQFDLPSYSVQAVPYSWTRKESAQEIAESLALPFDLDREPELDFKTPWINDFENQQIMLDTFFGALEPENSLIFLYAKRTPLADDPRRVLIGAGRITRVGPSQEYNYEGDVNGKLHGLMWERAISHSIRPDGFDGFVLPYQQILSLAERDGNIDPSQFVAFASSESFDAFSNVSEHVDHDQAIESLLALADKVRLTAKHISGNWDRHLEWISDRLTELWNLRGAFPGLGSALQAFEIRYGTLLVMDLTRRHMVEGRWEEDPWDLIAQAFKDPHSVLSPAVAEHIQSFDGKRLAVLEPSRLALLKLLSRFRLTAEQAKRFFDQSKRPKLSDDEILKNPYRLFETDRHRFDAVSIGVIDRGMFPDESVRSVYPLPDQTKLEGDQDPRRVRALAVHVLAAAEKNGHTLLPVEKVLEGIHDIELSPPCRPSSDLLPLLDPMMSPEVVDSNIADGTRAWQFGERQAIGNLLRKQVSRRRKGLKHVASYNWRELVNKSLGEMPDSSEECKVEERARIEKAAALAELFASRLSLLLGPAGTGKTRLLQILCELPEVKGDGVLLLAPTGKARIQMQGNIDGITAQTIAQFLIPERFDIQTQRYHLSDSPAVEAAGTVIIDEASMVTEDMLGAVINALRAPKRIILVGDHRQLPPIGAGRPLVDLAKEIQPDGVETIFPRVGDGYTELTVDMRRMKSGIKERDDVLLASWFSGEPLDPGADEIWVRMAQGKTDEHVEVRTWQTQQELEAELLKSLVDHVDEIDHDRDERGFGESLGGVITDRGVFFNSAWPERGRKSAAERCEKWQILSPVRGKGHGVDELNCFLHEHFKAEALRFSERKNSRTPRANGGQRIIYGDKVMSIVNERRHTLGGGNNLVSNGEIGMVVGQGKFNKNWDGKTPERLDVEYGTQIGNTFVYWPRDFGEDRIVLELAYALTIHKSQGSQFSNVFVVIPQPCFILGRELIYTALTRQIDRVVLFVQGQPTDIRSYASAKYSEVARRYTNLFQLPDMVADADAGFLERRLIHRTARNELVRSISEVVVADALHAEGIDYHYEKELRGVNGVKRYPDFTAEEPASGITVYWEHLGMLSDPVYQRRWNEKKEWYKQMGLTPNSPANDKGERLVTSRNRDNGAIDSKQIREQIREIFYL